MNDWEKLIWLDRLKVWTTLAKSFAFRYNPALQPRALIVYGCISKVITDRDVKQLLRILVKALESFTDTTLIDAIVMCLTRVLPLLRPESPIHPAVFWVAISVLQLDEVSLYASGLALLEQNLHTLDSQVFFKTHLFIHHLFLYLCIQLFIYSSSCLNSRIGCVNHAINSISRWWIWWIASLVYWFTFTISSTIDLLFYLLQSL